LLHTHRDISSYILAMTSIKTCLFWLAIGFNASCSRHEAPPPRPAQQVPSAPALTATNPATPARSQAATAPTNDDTIVTSIGPLTILPIRHASVLFTLGHKHIYVDPAADGKYEGLPKADFIFITHSHFDHFDKPRVESLRGASTVMVGPSDVISQMGRGQTLKNGEKHAFANFEVQAVPSYNLLRGPKPGQLFHPKGQGNGYVFTFGDKRVYVSGDTECTPELKELRNIDVAFLCMRLPYTMPPKEAAECIKAFKPQVLYPYHYETSILEELTAALVNEKNIEVRLRDWYPSK
jgi:L-ascorbate metabolism protein UlaG (beta-lactamase superfamily)